MMYAVDDWRFTILFFLKEHSFAAEELFFAATKKRATTKFLPVCVSLTCFYF